MRIAWLVIVGWTIAMGVAPFSSADTDAYRDIADPPIPPFTPLPTVPALPPTAPVPSAPPAVPTQPCSINGFIIDCSAAGIWATAAVPAWAGGYAGEVIAWESLAEDWPIQTLVPWGGAYGASLVTWEGQAQTWAMVEFNGWVSGAPGELISDEIAFTGPGGTTSATVHVHDVASGAYHDNVVFAIKGGPGGEMWLCEHSCVVPDTAFTVSIDPNDVPNNVWLGANSAFPLPNVPALSGVITVTFN